MDDDSRRIGQLVAAARRPRRELAELGGEGHPWAAPGPATVSFARLDAP